MGEVPDEHQIGDFFEALQKQCLECERLGKYEEADMAKTRMQALREHEEERRREGLRKQQLAERVNAEKAHMAELQEFNEIWDVKLADFEAHAANLTSTLAERHKQEHQAHLDHLRRDTEPRAPRWSSDLLNLRALQANAAKMQKYVEAEKTKVQADKMEAVEHATWKERRDSKIALLEGTFLKKQQLEMAGLLKRNSSGRNEYKNAFETELGCILQRHVNVKNQMESQQRIIQQRVQKYPAPSNTSVSRPSSPAGRTAIG